MRRLVIMAEGSFERHYGKTATGIIRYGQDEVVAVIDSTRAGQDVAQALGDNIGKGIPVVRDIHEALHYQPDTLLIGIAPQGGALPDSWRWQLMTAIEQGLHIISGLHMFLSDDQELRTAAEQHGVTIWDVRRPAQRQRVATMQPHRPGSHTVLLVGSDCATGKMSAAIELDRAARKRGWNSAFMATGQTGIMISGRGLPADRLISDFIAGQVEEMVLELTEQYDWVFVEGQGALNHPAYAPVTLGLLHGSRPDALIFSHIAGATVIEGYEQCLLPPLPRMIDMNEDALSWVSPDRSGKVVGLAVITRAFEEHDAQNVLRHIETETGLPATDVLRFGADYLLDALERHFSVNL